ncbi:MAG: HEAT repeat domain-containing protein [Cyanobacteria bacterium P01_D01_bin.50]
MSIPLLKDSDNLVRESVAEALGKLANTSDNVVVAVKKWLEEQQDSEYKEYGVMALWNSVVGES